MPIICRNQIYEMNADDVRLFIKGLGDLSTIPTLMRKILFTLRDENSSPDDLYRLIAHDQAFAERVVRVANSAFFGHSGEIKDIRQAIMFLGYDKIRSIAVGMSAMELIPAGSSFNIFSIKNLWIHSYEVALLSAAISEITPITSPRECFLSGLLHDIGRVIFYRLDPRGFYKIGTKDDMIEKETKTFGCTHADAGAWFAEEIGLPSEIVATMMHHHRPADAKNYKDAVSIVALSEAFSRRFSPRIEDDGIWTGEHDAILLELALNGDEVALIGEKLSSLRCEIENFFG